jgi:hypothetical protein
MRKKAPFSETIAIQHRWSAQASEAMRSRFEVLLSFAVNSACLIRAKQFPFVPCPAVQIAAS